MRLSPFHMELAKRIAKGQPNREIMKDIKVSGSRLSVLKVNPLFAKAVEEYRRQEADKYTKAIEVFAGSAESVAKEVVNLATSALTPHSVRLQAGEIVLDRLAMSEGHSKNGRTSEDQEVMFEQILRVTRRGSDREANSTDSGDVSEDMKALELDLVDTNDDGMDDYDDGVDNDDGIGYTEVTNYAKSA